MKQLTKGILVLISLSFLSACANQNGQSVETAQDTGETFDTEERADSHTAGGEVDGTVNGTGEYMWNQPPGEEVGQETGQSADNQSNVDSDYQLTQRIRQELVQDDSLSTNAQNIQINTENGKVTLEGVVSSAAEKSKVERHAKAAAGSASVENRLRVQ